MANQYSTAHRTSSMTNLNTSIGINAQIITYTGAMPANVAAAATGTLIVQHAGNATSYGAAASGVLTANAIAAANAAGAGNNVAGYFRRNTSAGVAVTQGLCSQQYIIATSAATAVNGNVLTFAATTGVTAGMNVSGTGVVAGTTVVAVTATTVTLSLTSTAGVGITVSITFGADMILSNTNIANGQSVSITSITDTANGA